MTQNEIMRANRISVTSNKEDIYTATFYRTHTVVASIDSTTIPNIEWVKHDVNAKDTTKTQLREDWRTFMITNANKYGIDYDPEDKRAPTNVRMATYPTDDDLKQDAIAMIIPTINSLMEKMPHRDLTKDFKISIDLIVPMTTTSKGTNLSRMSIEAGRYMKSGNWAWANIDGTVTITTEHDEIYEPIQLQLVSGQLKKPAITQTQWNTNITKSLIEIGLVTEDEKEKKKEKKPTEESTKTDTPTDGTKDTAKTEESTKTDTPTDGTKDTAKNKKSTKKRTSTNKKSTKKDKPEDIKTENTDEAENENTEIEG